MKCSVREVGRVLHATEGVRIVRLVGIKLALTEQLGALRVWMVRVTIQVADVDVQLHLCSGGHVSQVVRVCIPPVRGRVVQVRVGVGPPLQQCEQRRQHLEEVDEERRAVRIDGRAGAVLQVEDRRQGSLVPVAMDRIATPRQNVDVRYAIQWSEQLSASLPHSCTTSMMADSISTCSVVMFARAVLFERALTLVRSTPVSTSYKSANVSSLRPVDTRARMSVYALTTDSAKRTDVSLQQLPVDELRLGQWWRKEASGKGWTEEAMGKEVLANMLSGLSNSG